MDNETEQENQMCYMTHKKAMKTLFIIVIVATIAFSQVFFMLVMGLTISFIIINAMISGMLMLTVIPLIYIWRSPKITAFIKKNYIHNYMSVWPKNSVSPGIV